MKKDKKDETTEARILIAAKKIFIANGMTGARMQDIADHAGINKALLHYYFKNKEQLFEVVFKEASKGFFPRINLIFDSEDPLLEKLERFCAEYIDFILENPYLPLFVLNEVSRDPQYFFKKIWSEDGPARPRPEKFLKQMEIEMNKGNIKRVSPLQLLLNLISMTIFPFVGKPVIQHLLRLDELQFRATMEQRKKEIPKFIIDAIRK